MSESKLLRWLCLSGLLATLCYLVHALAGAAAWPGYDPMAQAVSDLTAVGAPSRDLASRWSSLYGLFSVLCVSVSWLVLTPGSTRLFKLGLGLFSAMIWVSAIGYTLFPLSQPGHGEALGDFIHLWVVTLAAMMAGSLGVGMVPPAWFGLMERFSTFSVAGFLTLLGLVGFFNRSGRTS